MVAKAATATPRAATAATTPKTTAAPLPPLLARKKCGNTEGQLTSRILRRRYPFSKDSRMLP